MKKCNTAHSLLSPVKAANESGERLEKKPCLRCPRDRSRGAERGHRAAGARKGRAAGTPGRRTARKAGLAPSGGEVPPCGGNQAACSGCGSDPKPSAGQLCDLEADNGHLRAAASSCDAGPGRPRTGARTLTARSRAGPNRLRGAGLPAPASSPGPVRVLGRIQPLLPELHPAAVPALPTKGRGVTKGTRRGLCLTLDCGTGRTRGPGGPRVPALRSGGSTRAPGADP